MNFIRSLIPDDWYMKLFSPPEDNIETNSSGIYLHIRQPNVSLPLRLINSTRYDVVSFFQNYHDNSYHLTLSREELLKHTNNLLSLPIDNSDNLYQELQKCFESFQQNEMVFVKPSSLEIEHNPDDNEKWITTFIKKNENGTNDTEDDIIASINVYKNYKFPNEKEIVEPNNFD
jgi:hypothetical protein